MPNDTSSRIENVTVNRVKGVAFPDPTSADDGKVLVYSHTGSTYSLGEASDIAGAVTEVSLTGDVSGTSEAAVVEAIQGIPVPAPTSSDDEKVVTYDHDTLSFKYEVVSDIADNEADVFYFRQVGTSPFERYYFAGMQSEVQLATVSGATGTLRAMPFVAPRGGTIDRLAVGVTTGAGAGGVARWGVYQATSITNLYPDALLVDAGEVDVTGIGTKAQTINLTLQSGVLYWFVYLGGVSAATIRAVNTAGTWPIFGYSNAFASAGAANIDPGVALTVAQAYGTLPDPFPAGATIITAAAIPAVGCRFSA